MYEISAPCQCLPYIVYIWIDIIQQLQVEIDEIDEIDDVDDVNDVDDVDDVDEVDGANKNYMKQMMQTEVDVVDEVDEDECSREFANLALELLVLFFRLIISMQS